MSDTVVQATVDQTATVDQSKKRKLEDTTDTTATATAAPATTPTGFYAFVLMQGDNHKTWRVPVEDVPSEIMSRIRDVHDDYHTSDGSLSGFMDEWNFAINYINDLDADSATYGNKPIYGPLAEVLIFDC